MSFLSRVKLHLMMPLAVVALFAFGQLPAARAQFAPPPHETEVHDTSVLHPPAGAKVAIVEFADLQCPDCARANSLLKAAAERYNIPWVRFDFPLPFHSWSFQAAVNARWFDQKSKALGDDYRDSIFVNQPTITSPDVLRQFTEEFAKNNKIELPTEVDPSGKLADAVKADYALGQKIGIEHTPTIWVVTNKSEGTPFVEVVDRSMLYALIEEALEASKTPAQ